MRTLLFGLFFVVACRETPKQLSLEETSLPDDTQVDTQTQALDVDEDGYEAGEDCDDADAAVNPEADELCDGIDNDCDGLVDDADDSVVDSSAWYQDLDSDGYGNEAVEQLACDSPLGYVQDDTDCNDLDARFHPGADESDCTDENDYNCDGSVGFADADGDGYAACEDCDDAAATSSPLGIEVCDGADNDCDGTVDEEDAVDATAWYSDADSDGYGDADSVAEACDAPSGYVGDDTDCDDTSADTHPGASETCDQADNDCDGLVDSDDPDVSGATVYYLDADGDGYGGQQLQVSACEAPSGYVSSSDDCNDLDAASYPGATEICDEADNDCDADVDEGVGLVWYEDADSDGFGNANVSATACDAPSGHVGNALDCDDTNVATNPGSYEVCDAQDNDCDGSVDEQAINAATWYIDSDGDGYGSFAATLVSCEAPTGYTGNSGDCDDTQATVSPLATETCDSLDNDCDGGVDEGVSTVFYADADGDGAGDSTVTINACEVPSGYAASGGDCDDTDASLELSDADADGFTTCDGDCDDTDASLELSDADGDGFTTCDGDCDDTNAALELSDADGDGFTLCDGDCDDGDASSTTTASDADCDGTLTAEDCDDTNATSATVATDGDCDGTLTAEDCDDGDAASTTVATDGDCDGSLTGADCNDGDGAIYPGATETCDGLDNDCDGVTDPPSVYGDAAACAGSSCEDILSQRSGAPDGAYVVNLGAGAFDVYCDMTTDGGGWTLLLKTSGDTDFDYDDPYWTNDSLLNETSLDTDTTQNTKLQAFTDLTINELRGCFPTQGGHCLDVQTNTSQTAKDIFSGGSIQQGTGFDGQMYSGWSYQPNCNWMGVNTPYCYRRARLGLTSNQEGNCSSNDTAIGFGLAPYCHTTSGERHGSGQMCMSSQCSQGNVEVGFPGLLWGR